MKPRQNQAKDPEKVNKRDVCATPAHAIEPLLPLIPKHWIIWECACGPEQLMVKAFQAHGYTVHSTDLLHGENFFTYEPISRYNIIVTNPPWSLKYEFIERCLALGKPFALLVPYETVAAGTFQDLCKEYGACFEVLAPERRINFKMPDKGWGKEEWDEKQGKFVMKGDSAQMPTCWLTFGLDVQIKTIATIHPVPMRKVKYDENNQEIVK
jgi:hypothetical protein